MHHFVLARGSALAMPLALALTLGGCSSAQPVDVSVAAAAEKAASQAKTATSSTAAAPAVLPTQSSIADLVERVAPMVVNITTVHKLSNHRSPFGHPFFGPDRRERRRMPRARTGAGTGFIVDASGYVITNAHVVSEADEVKVRLKDDRQLDAEVVGRDRQLDLALLRLKGVADLPAAPLGRSDTLRVGEHVVAVGNPFGLGHTVTMGIVSAKARSIGAGPYDDFIQTDASINPGNSGGPLFNLRGEVIGINTAIRAGADGIGFAIPVDALKDVVEQLKRRGFVERGKLGLAFQPITPEIAKALKLDRPHGALVSEIVDGSAAAKAGIRAGDLIVAINGQAIRRSEELPRKVARHAPGTTIEVKVLRNGANKLLRAKLDKLESEDAPREQPRSTKKTPKSSMMMGIEARDEVDGGVRVLKLQRIIKGVLPGDVIVEANGRAIKNLKQLHAVTKSMKEGDTVLLKLRRGTRHRYAGVRLTR